MSKVNGQVIPYNGHGVQTEGPGRYARVVIGGRACWARAYKNDRAARETIGEEYGVTVLGWHRGQSIFWSDLTDEARAILRATID